MADSPAIPLTAKSYGIPLESSPEVLVVYCNADYFDKSRWVMTYEIDKYLVDHNFPLPDGESLLEVRVRGMEVCPEYFGEFPIPTETPWGAPLQHDRLANGVFWLRTEKAGWVLALAYPICDSLLPETGGMGKALLYTLGVLLLCLVTATEYRKRKSTRSQSSYK